jgi:hypothetical protein
VNFIPGIRQVSAAADISASQHKARTSNKGAGKDKSKAAATASNSASPATPAKPIKLPPPTVLRASVARQSITDAKGDVGTGSTKTLWGGKFN